MTETTVDYEKMLALLRGEVAPSLGCTEPISVALAAAKAREVLGAAPQRIEVWVSGNIYKNGVGVSVPGTGMCGLQIAAAVGALGGDASAELEVLKSVTDEDLRLAREMLERERVKIRIKKDVAKLYVEAFCTRGENFARVVIQDRHSQIASIERNGETILEKQSVCLDPEPRAPGQPLETTLAEIWAFATTVDLDRVRFLAEGAEMNKAIAEEGLRGEYGLRVGRRTARRVRDGVLGDDLCTRAMVLTAAACDARMGGCMMPVMSNTGSGNQGLTATLPVVAAAAKLGSDEEALLRALTLSNLVAIHIKKGLGRLSALCGCVVAASGAGCGIAYLMGGGLNEAAYTIKNMIANVPGILCDGAKEGCALKVSTAASAAVQSALLAMDGVVVSGDDGIIDSDVEQTIRNLARVGSEGMRETDALILDIMVCK